YHHTQAIIWNRNRQTTDIARWKPRESTIDNVHIEYRLPLERKLSLKTRKKLHCCRKQRWKTHRCSCIRACATVENNKRVKASGIQSTILNKIIICVNKRYHHATLIHSE